MEFTTNKLIIGFIIILVLLLIIWFVRKSSTESYRGGYGLGLHDHNKRLLDQMRYRSLHELNLIDAELATLPAGYERSILEGRRRDLLKKLDIYFG